MARGPMQRAFLEDQAFDRRTTGLEQRCVNQRVCWHFCPRQRHASQHYNDQQAQQASGRTSYADSFQEGLYMLR